MVSAGVAPGMAAISSPSSRTVNDPKKGKASTRAVSPACACKRRSAQLSPRRTWLIGAAAMKDSNVVNDQACWMPAINQPLEPFTGFCRCQISSNDSGCALGSSRIKPVKRTLAM